MSRFASWSRALAALFALALVTGAFAGEDDQPGSPEKPKGGKKAPGAKEKVQNPAPDFTLPAPDGKRHSLKDYRGKVVVLEWINHGCPFVMKRYDAGTMQKLQKTYGEKGVVWLSVCSSAPGKQGYYTPEQWKKLNVEKKSAAKAVLLDPDGKVGRLYSAKTTPHMFVIDRKGGIVYQGAIDDSKWARRPEEIRAAKSYVAPALDAVLSGKKPAVAKTPPFGCSVKYARP